MIRIFGASDDLVEIDGDVTKEIDALGRPVIIEVGDESHGGVLVLINHTEQHGWTLALGQLLVAPAYIGDAPPIPWPVNLRTKTEDDPDWYPDYSPILEIDCPADERVEVVSNG